MTPNEFKAWFDGFTENVDKQPTQKQWARIKERVAEIDGKSVTERVYVDRYWPAYPRTFQNYPPIYTATYNAANAAAQMSQSAGGFNSIHAMNALGKAEANS